MSLDTGVRPDALHDADTLARAGEATSFASNPLEAILEHAKRTPSAPAIVSADTILSFSEYVDTASRLATFLTWRGVRRGIVVGLDSGFSPVMQTVLTAACWYLGVTSCVVTHQISGPVPFATSWVLVTPRRLGGDDARQIVVDGDTLGGLGVCPREDAPRPYGKGDACRLVFTSGTTGRAKAVTVGVDSLKDRVREQNAGVRAGEVFMTALGETSIMGYTCMGASLCAGRPFLVSGTPSQTVQLLKRYRVHTLSASPIQLSGIADVLDKTRTPLPDLRVVCSMGATLNNLLRDRLRVLVSARVVSVYGSTEIGPIVANENPDSSTRLAGTVDPAYEVQVVSSGSEPLPDGTSGLIRVRRRRKPHLPRSYYGEARHPDSPTGFRDGWFYPGDVGYLVGDELYLDGRIDDLINASGIKVAPSEIESALIGVGGVTDAAAAQFEGDDGATRIGVVLVGSVDLREVGGAATRALGEKAPRRYVVAAGIPRNTNGKIQRDAVRALLAEREEPVR